MVDVEPLAVDVRADSKAGTLKKLGREVNRLLAAMIGCPYDALVQRQQKRQRRRLLLGAGAVLTVAMLFSGMMLVKNQQIDAKNEELEKTNQQLEEQKAQLQLNESELLTGQANQYLETGELGLALPYALDAVVDIRIKNSTLKDGSPIQNVYFNEEKGTTCVLWDDGKKTLIHCAPEDTWDKEKDTHFSSSQQYFLSVSLKLPLLPRTRFI